MIEDGFFYIGDNEDEILIGCECVIEYLKTSVLVDMKEDVYYLFKKGLVHKSFDVYFTNFPS